MTDVEQKQIFAKNLNHYLSLSNKSQKEVADAIGVSPQTFNTWCQAIALPRMGKVQKLADYFNIGKTDLIDDKTSIPSAPTFTLTTLEKQIIIEYRNADEITQAMVLRALSIDESLGKGKEERMA